MNQLLTNSILALLLLCACSSSDESVQPQQSTEWAIGFPPTVNAEQRNFSSELLQDLNVKLIRINEDWRFREPEQEQFNWQPLDNRVAWAVENGIEILLTIQSIGPDWACGESNDNSCVYTNWEAFENYIRNLLERYPQGISKIQFGNEWQTESWYLGTAEEFVRGNNIVFDLTKEIRPEIDVVLGGFSTTALAYLAGCAGKIDSFYDQNSILIDAETLAQQCQTQEFIDAKARVDYVLANAKYDYGDAHFYDDVENWSIYFNHFSELVSKPIMVTEFGGPNLELEPNTESYQAEQLTKYMNAIKQMNLEEAYFFKLVEGSMNPVHVKSGLIRSSDLGKKESYYIFKSYSASNP